MLPYSHRDAMRGNEYKYYSLRSEFNIWNKLLQTVQWLYSRIKNEDIH